ncbi:MAG: hypothetical protein ACLGIB_12635 [Actinomycetota bacterium]
MQQNVLGQDLTRPQQELMACYDRLVAVLTHHRDELAPFEERNTLKAVAALWQVANGLDMDRGQTYHLGA